MQRCVAQLRREISLKIVACLPVLCCLIAVSAGAADLDRSVDQSLPGLLEQYKDIHAHPESSHHEERTAALFAYATPLCSALLLSFLGVESMTWNLLIGAVVIAVAGTLSRTA